MRQRQNQAGAKRRATTRKKKMHTHYTYTHQYGYRMRGWVNNNSRRPQAGHTNKRKKRRPSPHCVLSYRTKPHASSSSFIHSFPKNPAPPCFCFFLFLPFRADFPPQKRGGKKPNSMGLLFSLATYHLAPSFRALRCA